MSSGQSARNLSGNVKRLLDFNRGLADFFLERFSPIISHGNEPLSIFGLGDFINGADIGMIKCGRGFGFLDKSSLSVSIVAQLR